MSSRDMENWGIGAADPVEILGHMRSSEASGDQNSFWFFCHSFKISVEKKFLLDREFTFPRDLTMNEALALYERFIIENN